MNKRTTRLAIGGLVAMTLLAAACGSDDKSDSTTRADDRGRCDDGRGATTAAPATTAGGAATTRRRLRRRRRARRPRRPDRRRAPRRRRSAAPCRAAARRSSWPTSRRRSTPSRRPTRAPPITYGGGGSGKGRTDLANKIVDFAGSDSAYADADKPAEPILYFPILLGADHVSYNLDGVDKLQLSPDTIAKIFQRQITKWNDAAIAADNPGAKLPSTDIVVAHRTDGSGTTAELHASGWRRPRRRPGR